MVERITRTRRLAAVALVFALAVFGGTVAGPAAAAIPECHKLERACYPG